jgi:predicted ATPase
MSRSIQITRLLSALRDKKALLLFDNCEHLIDAAAVLTDRVLAACPRVRVTHCEQRGARHHR